MISMTGYGRATCLIGGRRLIIELRSVNHRFFDLKVRLPWTDATVEALVGQAVRGRIERGALTLSIRDEPGGQGMADVRVNLPLARRYHEALGELADALGMDRAQVGVALVAGLRDVLSVGEPERSGEELYELLRPALGEALGALDEMRRREGQALGASVRAQAKDLVVLVGRMTERAQASPAEYRARLEERLARVLGQTELDPQRIAQEVAILADRTDVGEELVRLASHLAQLEALCTASGAVGRKLDFLLQELNREVNTVGSKAQSSELATMVVEAKAVLERIREQVQNVE